MNQIKCPKCGNVFTIDENDYEDILRQVRNDEFEKELKIREQNIKLENENNINLLKVSLEKEYNESLNKYVIDINNLKNDIKLEKIENEHKIKEAIEEKEKNILKLENEINNNKNEYLLKEKNLNESYLEKIKLKDEQIAYYKDFKAKQSTKMIGESLEQHCLLEFNKVRSIFNEKTYFEKDNDAKSGSKGDFIFRDYDDDGIEVVSIMFEMKNEADETSTKHKNEDFLKELDKDRKEKNCEYAVLVSLLESNNEIYNDGIVDMSYKYEKMYVIRPQFFIPIITLIRNAALNTVKIRKELIAYQNQNIDITHFEENINLFKDSFSRNYRLASEKFKKAIEEIDKTIDHLQKTKESLISSENQLRIANNKADDLTIKKLTNNSKTVRDMFDSLK